jgi:hypothetical protein
MLVAGTPPLVCKHRPATSTWPPSSAWPSSHNTGTGSLSPTSWLSLSHPQPSSVSTKISRCRASSSTPTPSPACSTTRLSRKSRRKKHLRRSRLQCFPPRHKPSVERLPRTVRTAARAWTSTNPQLPNPKPTRATRWTRTWSSTHQRWRTRRRSHLPGRNCKRRRWATSSRT